MTEDCDHDFGLAAYGDVAPATRPPTPTQLAAALASLPSPTMAAAVHLALPRSSRVGVEAWREDGGWRWRDVWVATPVSQHGADAGYAAAALELAHAGARPGDEWLDLTGPPGSWVKPAVSGTRLVAFGLPLLGGPGLVADRGTPAAAVHAVADLALRGGLQPPSVVATPRGDVLVGGSSELLRLSLAPAGSDAPAESGAGWYGDV
jgi:hypothetical protein